VVMILGRIELYCWIWYVNPLFACASMFDITVRGKDQEGSRLMTYILILYRMQIYSLCIKQVNEKELYPKQYLRRSK